MFARIMSIVISAGVLLTLFAAISYGLNVAEASAVVVFGGISSFILFAAIISLAKSLLGLTKGALEQEKRQYLADLEDNKERQIAINREIRRQNAWNFWKGILRLIAFGIIFYSVITGLPLALGTSLEGIKEFFTVNPVGSFMMVHILGLIPMWFFLPLIYLSGFYGPFLIKVFLFDMRLMGRGSEEFSVNREDIVGQDENLDRLEGMLNDVQDWRALKAVGVKPERGAIAVGPPGTGKTHTMRYLAGRYGMAMVEIKSTISRQTFIGVAVIAMAIARWRTVRHAKKNDGALVLIDEIDLLGQKRSETPPQRGGLGSTISNMISYMPTMGSGSDDSALIVLMTWLDGIASSAPFWYRMLRGRINTIMDAIFIDEFVVIPIVNLFGAGIKEPWRIPAWKTESYDNTFFFGTTNRPQVLDPALMRHGRLHEQLFYDLPGHEDRIALVKYFMRRMQKTEALDSDEGLTFAASITEGMSHSDIEGVTHRAWTNRHADLRRENRDIQKEDVLVDLTDLLKARSDTTYGLARSASGALLSNLRRTAIHEAGHAVVTAGIPTMLKDRANATHPTLLHVSAKRRGMSLGRVESTTLIPVDTRWQSDFEARISIALGSYATELIFFEETTSGAKGDLAAATLLAMQMHSFFGWGPRKCSNEERKEYFKLGMAILASNEQSAGFLAKESNLQYSPLVRETFGRDQWLNPYFAEDFVKNSVSHESQRDQIAVILGQALVRSFRFVAANQEAVKKVAKKLEEEGWEMEGRSVTDFFDTLDFDKIWRDDPWPILDSSDPFYETRKSPER